MLAAGEERLRVLPGNLEPHVLGAEGGLDRLVGRSLGQRVHEPATSASSPATSRSSLATFAGEGPAAHTNPSILSFTRATAASMRAGSRSSWRT